MTNPKIDEGEPTARVMTPEEVSVLLLEVRRTSYRFSKERGAGKRRRLYLALYGMDGDPKGFGKALGKVFDSHDQLALIRLSDLKRLIGGPPDATASFQAALEAKAGAR